MEIAQMVLPMKKETIKEKTEKELRRAWLTTADLIRATGCPSSDRRKRDLSGVQRRKNQYGYWEYHIVDIEEEVRAFSRDAHNNWAIKFDKRHVVN